MATSYTSLLGFALPVTGELDGTWGDVVNNSITQLVEDSVAGVATASVTAGNWTLSTTGSGAANEARCAILIPTGSPGVSRNIVAPSQSKAYIVINQSNASVVVKGSATTGATVLAGQAALVAWNGSDFVAVSSGDVDGPSSATDNAVARFDGTTGKLIQNSAVTIADTTGDIAGAGSITSTSASGILTRAASTQDGVIMAGRAGGTGSYAVTLTPATLSSSTTLTLPNVTDTVATIGTAQTFTAAQTFRAANAIRSEAASTQDAIVIAGRAGGTSSYAITLTPATLSASRTVTLPDGGGNYTLGYLNVPQSGSDKTTSYSLATTDVGKFVGVGASGSITIPDATFAAGDVISLFNNTTGNITITCSITTAYIAGTDSDKATMTLATRGVATILFLSGTVCVVSGNVT